MGCSLCLKYNVVLYDSEKATPEQLKHRIYGHHTHKGNKRRLPEDRMLDENLPIWGKLSPLNVLTRTEMLQGEKTTIGRGKDCDIVIERDFISRERKSSFDLHFIFCSFVLKSVMPGPICQ